MLLHLYDENTKEYIGSMPALLDPLESAKQGRNIYATPPFCTTVAPVPCDEGEVSVYNSEGDNWVVMHDFRGLILYNEKTGEPFKVTELGDLPEGYVRVRPVFLKEEKEKLLKEINEKFIKEYEKGIIVNKVPYNEKEISVLKRSAEVAEEKIVYCKENGDLIEFSKEEVLNIINTYRERLKALPEKKSELIKKVRKAKSLKELEKIKISF